jgi:hypothetical protein
MITLITHSFLVFYAHSKLGKERKLKGFPFMDCSLCHYLFQNDFDGMQQEKEREREKERESEKEKEREKADMKVTIS